MSKHYLEKCTEGIRKMEIIIDLECYSPLMKTYLDTRSLRIKHNSLNALIDREIAYVNKIV